MGTSTQLRNVTELIRSFSSILLLVLDFFFDSLYMFRRTEGVSETLFPHSSWSSRYVFIKPHQIGKLQRQARMSSLTLI